MYLGQIVELAESGTLYHEPCHPYTLALLSSIPVPDPRLAKNQQAIVLEGDVPSPIDPPAGCRFLSRCPAALPRCGSETPVLKEVGANHFVSCHLA